MLCAALGVLMFACCVLFSLHMHPYPAYAHVPPLYLSHLPLHTRISDPRNFLAHFHARCLCLFGCGTMCFGAVCAFSCPSWLLTHIVHHVACVWGVFRLSCTQFFRLCTYFLASTPLPPLTLVCFVCRMCNCSPPHAFRCVCAHSPVGLVLRYRGLAA